MIKKLILCFISIIATVTSQKCFINSDITKSEKLFTYKGNVYDITGYKHPGGSATLKRTLGAQLEDYISLPKYDFHLTNNEFKNDMKKMYVGVLKDNCEQEPTEETTEEPTTEETTEEQTTESTTEEPTDPTTEETNPTTGETDPTTEVPTDPSITTSSTPASCLLFNFIPVIPYTQQNMMAEVNIDNVSQNDTSITLSLTPDIGGSRISTEYYIQYGQIDAFIKPSKGLNVINGFYIQADNGDAVIFNIIQNNQNKNSTIETNFYYSGNLTYDVNAQYHEPDIILSETFNKYSIIWFPTYYEWRLNDVLLRRLNITDTVIFPDSPSKVKLSIWEGDSSMWAGPGIQWTQAPFKTQLSSLNIRCNNSKNYSKLVKTDNSEYNTPSISSQLKYPFALLLISLFTIGIL